MWVQILLVHLRWKQMSTVEFWELFIYSGCNCFVKYAISNDFLSFYSLSLYPVNSFFCRQKVWTLMFNLESYQRTLFLIPGHKSFLLCICYLQSYCSWHSVSTVWMEKFIFCCWIVWYLSQTRPPFWSIVRGDFDTPVIILSLHWMSILFKEKQFRQHIGCIETIHALKKCYSGIVFKKLKAREREIHKEEYFLFSPVINVRQTGGNQYWNL